MSSLGVSLLQEATAAAPALNAESKDDTSDDQITRMGLCITITSIHSINTSRETAVVSFDATYFVASDSREHAFELIREMAGESWVVGGIETSDVDEGTEFNEQDGLAPGAYAIEFHRVSTVKMDMDLQFFPFDIQDLPLRIYISDTAVELVDPREFWPARSQHMCQHSLLCLPSCLISEEWQMNRPLIDFSRSDRYETLRPYPQVNVTLKLARKGAGYAIRYLSLMVVMSLGSLLPFIARPVIDTSDRLSFEMGLLFTVVAFQLIISSFLPVSSTTTVLDVYGLFLFCFVCACMAAVTFSSIRVEATINSSMSDETANEIRMENSLSDGWWLFVAWLVFHALYAGRIAQIFWLRQKQITTPIVRQYTAYICEGGKTMAEAVVRCGPDGEGGPTNRTRRRVGKSDH